MTTIKRFQDYEEDDPELDFRKMRYQWWETLKKVRNEYTQEAQDFNTKMFSSWLLEKYGIKLKLMDDHITDMYQIVDEQKYLVFILKYK